MGFRERNLLKELRIIAAKKLQNTRSIPASQKERLELLAVAFGRDTIVNDFTTWCEEHAAEHPRYPLFDYIRIVEGRLGATPKVEVHDPRIPDLQSFTYELAGVLPPPDNIRDILARYEMEEVKAALQEFVLTLDNREMKSAVELFFNGGAAAVIQSRRKRGLK